jgi:hypothetical protein
MTTEPGPGGGRPDPALSVIMSERRQLINLAYRLLGSLADAEDAVQETYAPWYAMSRQDRDAVASAGAWLSKVGRPDENFVDGQAPRAIVLALRTQAGAFGYRVEDLQDARCRDIDFPHAAQVVRIRRDEGKTRTRPVGGGGHPPPPTSAPAAIAVSGLRIIQPTCTGPLDRHG